MTEASYTTSDPDFSDLPDSLAEQLEANSIEATLSSIAVKTERMEGRQRQISAQIQIPYPVAQVWQILTDYNHLADFIPNLAKSRQIEHPDGGIRIEQVGTQSFLSFKFCARVVLDMVEKFPKQIDFCMVQGDFKTFSGSWQLEPLEIAGQPATTLTYVIQVLPPRTMPIGMIERRLCSGLAENLAAIRQRADTLFQVS